MKGNLRALALVILAAIPTVLPVAAWATTPWTPIAWQDGGKLRNWVRDQNQNFVDDELEMQTGQSTVVVDLNRCAGDPAQSGIIQYLKTVGDVIYVGRYVTFVVVTGITPNESLQIAQRPEVAMVEAIPPMTFQGPDRQAMKVEHSTYYPLNLAKLVQWKWPTKLNGKGVNIAIVDSGVCDDNNQPSQAPAELKGKYQYGYDVSSKATEGKFINPKGNPPQSGHGTLMAQFALGKNSGIAPGAGLVDIKFGSDDKSIEEKKNNSLDNEMSYLRFLDALETIVEKNKDWNIGVVNLSTTQYQNQPSPYDGNDCVSQLVNRVAAEGIVVVASAGNQPPMRPPATASWAITVGAATSPKSTPQRQFYKVPSGVVSGPRPDNLDQDPLDEMKPEVVAPALWTSPAAARISGLAALMLQKAPDLNAGSLKDLLIRTAETRGTPSAKSRYQVKYPQDKATWNEQWGFGLVDAYQAVTNLLDSPDATDLTFKGFDGSSHPSSDPPWYYSPALKITDQSGKALNSLMKAGTDYTIHARLWNNGPKTAKNVRVNFAFYWFTAGANVKGKWNIPRFHHIGAKLVPEIKPGEKLVGMNWRAPDHPLFEHGCVFVSIDYGLDSKFSNQSNFAQRNLQVKSTASPAVYRFRLENALPTAATLKLLVTTKNHDWTLHLSQDTFFMDTHGCAPIVEAKVIPPADARPGDESLFYITPLATPVDEGQIVELGGVALRTIVGESKKEPDQPPPARPVAPPDDVATPGQSGVHGRVFALDAGGRIRGTVAAADIEFHSPEGQIAARATSDELGYYKARLQPGTYSYKVRAADFRDDDVGRGLQVKLRDRFSVYNFALTDLTPPKEHKPPREDPQPDKKKQPLVIQVVRPVAVDGERDTPRHEPLDGARVEIRLGESLIASGISGQVSGDKLATLRHLKIDAETDGIFVSDPLPVLDGYYVAASKEGFHPEEKITPIRERKVHVVVLTPLEEHKPPRDEPKPDEQKQPLVIHVVRPVAVDGERDAPRHEPLDGARVEIRLGESLVASGISGQDKEGIFVSDPLPLVDGYYVAVSKEGFHPAEKVTPIQRREAHIVVLTPLEEHKPPDKKPPRKEPQLVRVQVVDRDTNRPLDGAAVIVGVDESTHLRGEPEGRGLYRFELDRRNYWIHVAREGYGQYESRLDLGEQMKPRYTVQLRRLTERPPPDTPPAEARIVVQVLDASRRDRPGIGGADVLVRWSGREIARGTTRRDGAAEFRVRAENFEREDYEVMVTKDQFVPSPARAALEVRRGFGECIVELRREDGRPPSKPPGPREAMLRVRVVDASQRERPGIGGAEVRVNWSGRQVAQGQTDEHGVVTLRLTPRRFERESYEVVVVARGYQPLPARKAAEVLRGHGQSVFELREVDSPHGEPPGEGATLVVQVQGLDLSAPIGAVHALGGAQVVVHGHGRRWEGRTTGDGQWRIKLPEGRYRIDATYHTATKPATVEVMVGRQGEVQAPPLVIKYRTPD